MKKELKFLVVGDLHGIKPNLHFKDFDAIIVPGDICGDSVKKYHFLSLKDKLDGKTQRAWYDICGREKAQKLVESDLQIGRKTLEYLNSLGKPVFVNPGNWEYTNEEKNMPWDTSYYNQFWNFLNKNHFKDLVKGLENLVTIHHKKIDFNGISIIGYGINTGPEYLDSDIGSIHEKEKRNYYRDNYNILSNLFKSSNNPVLFVSHNVPYNTKLDEIRNSQSPRNGEHFGSVVARDLTSKYNPIITIGSHIHENFGQDRLNSVPLINAGFGSDCNTRITIRDGKVCGIEFAGITPEFP